MIKKARPFLTLLLLWLLCLAPTPNSDAAQRTAALISRQAIDVDLGFTQVGNVGNLSIMGAPSGATFSLLNNPGGHFSIVGTEIIAEPATPPGQYTLSVQAIGAGFSVHKTFVLNFAGTPVDQFSIGINLSGAEINFPQFPQIDEMTYLANRVGLKEFRIPLAWSKANQFFGPQGIQLVPFGDLNATYLASLLTVINNAHSLGARVVPDIHMFGAGPGIGGAFTISNLTSVGTLATATYTSVSGSGPIDGITATIIGSTPTTNDNFYNVNTTIFNVTPTTFQYTMAGVPANSPATKPPGSNWQGQEFADVGTTRLPVAALTDLWRKFATWLRANAPADSIGAYDFMNEWAIADTSVAFTANQAITTALRADGDSTTLWYEGNNFSGAWNWTDTNDNFYQIVDPANNNIISPHNYFDYNSSGQHQSYALNIATPGEAPTGTNVNPTIGVQRLQRQVAPWAQTHGKNLIIGEGGVSNDPLNSGGNDNSAAWNLIWDNTLAFAQANKIGYIWWGNGPGFGSGYPLNISPTSVANPNIKDYSGNGLQAPQTVIFDKYTGYSGPQPTAYRNDLPTIVTATGNPETPALQIVNSGPVGAAIPNFISRYNALISAPITVTPHDTIISTGQAAGGTFTPPTLTYAPGMNALDYFSYTPSVGGQIAVATTNDDGLTNPPAINITTASVPAPSVAIPLPWTGANLSGMESNNAIFPVGQGSPLAGVYNNSYSAYYHFRGMNMVRLPFKRERIQPRLMGVINNSLNFGGSGGLDALDGSVNDAVNSGMLAMLDIHDFGGTLSTIDISSVVVVGTTATCTVADTSILVAGANLTLGGSAVNSSGPIGAITIVDSTHFTIPVPGGTPSSGATTGVFPAFIGGAGYTSAMFADFVGKLATRYAGYPNVAIDLMNEPNNTTAVLMAAASQAAITAARAAGFTGYIFAEVGGSFSKAGAFSTTLSTVGSFLTDPLNKTIYQVHSYLDAGGSGSSASPAPPPGTGAVSLLDCTEYARAHGLKLFLGEFGISPVSTMITEVTAQLAYISANPDVWVGWTAWTTAPYVILPPEVAAGPFHFPSPSGIVTDAVAMPTLLAAGPSSFFVAPPSGINMNWGSGFDAGQVPATTSIGTVLTGALTAQEPNIDGPGTTTFALVSNPGGLFSINGTKQLVLAGALTDFTTVSISIQVTNAQGVSATFPVNVISNSVTTIDPATVNTAVYTLSNGNLTILHTAAPNAVSSVYLTKGKSGGGPYCFELHFDSGFTSGDQPVQFTRIFGQSTVNPGPAPPGFWYLPSIIVQNNTALISSSVQGVVASITYAAVRPVAGDTLRVWWNPSTHKLGLTKNSGNWNNNVANDPATGALDFSSLPETLFVSYGAFSQGEGVTFNFGATPFAFPAPVGCNNL